MFFGLTAFVRFFNHFWYYFRGMVSFRESVVEALARQLKTSGMDAAQVDAVLETPPKPEMGDLAFPCFQLAKSMKKNPIEIAKELQAKMVAAKIAGLEKIEVAGPYLNFFVTKKALAESVLKAVLKEKEKYGRNDSHKKKVVMVEYSSPNSNKPLHIGHLRNQAIGMALSNGLEANGYKVVKANLINDRGAHICKSMLAYEKWGKGETPKSSGIKGDHLAGNYYVLFAKEAEKNESLNEEIQKMLQQWEQGDAKVKALWKKMNGWAIEGLEETYRTFGSRFDVVYKESEFFDKAGPIVKKGLELGVFEKDEDGSTFANLEKHGLPNKIVLRKDGTSIYLTNDLALTPQKFRQFKLDEALWVVAMEQDLYFRQLFKIFELLQQSFAQHCRHVSYGWVTLPSGRLKSREGTTVDADDVIAEMKSLALQEVKKRHPELKEKEAEKRALAIGLAAIKFFLLKTEFQKNIQFNPEDSLSFEGETGPYVMYAFARAKSILRKAPKSKGTVSFAVLQEDAEKKLLSLLQQYPDMVARIPQNHSLHSMAQFLLELSAAFNSFYHAFPVLDAPENMKAARLALVESVAQVLSNGLRLLDLPVLEEM